MGYALAEAALRRGARVLLVRDPPPSSPRRGLRSRGLNRSTDDPGGLTLLPEASIVIKSAAVSDYRR